MCGAVGATHRGRPFTSVDDRGLCGGRRGDPTCSTNKDVCTLTVNTVICAMIINFKSKATEDVYDGMSTRHSRSIPVALWSIAQRKLDMINAAVVIDDLRVPPGNRLEALRGSMKGYHSVRVNDQYRVVFRWQNDNAHDVEIVDYHK